MEALLTILYSLSLVGSSLIPKKIHSLNPFKKRKHKNNSYYEQFQTRILQGQRFGPAFSIGHKICLQP